MNASALTGIKDHRYLAMAVASAVLVSAVLLATPQPALALLPGLAIAGILLVDRYPAAFFLAIVALIPFGEFRTVEGSLGFVRIHWIIGILLVLLTFLHSLPDRRLRQRLRSNLWLPVIALLAAQTMAALFSPYPGTAYTNVALTAAAYVFMAVGIVFLPRLHIYRRALPRVLVGSVSAGSLLAVLGFFFGVSLFAEKVTPGDFRRGVGGAPDPNNMSLMVIFVLPLLVHWLIHARRLPGRLAAGGLMFINIMAIVTTFSRGGALIFLLTMAGLGMEYRHRLRARSVGPAATVLAILAGLALWFAPPDYWQWQHSVVEAEDSAMQRRASYLLVALDAFQQRPVVGHGPGTFPDIYAQTEEARRHTRPGRSLRRFAHNTYIEILIGTGLLGLVPFVMLLWRGMRNYTQARRAAVAAGDHQLAMLTGSYRLSYIVLLVYLLIFSDPYHKYLMLALALSCAAVAVTSTESSNTYPVPDSCTS